MTSLEVTESTFTWLTVGPLGTKLSTTLPKEIKTFKDFVKADIATGDNDPTYWAIVRAREEWGLAWAAKFCTAMLTYYHVGTAAEAADHDGVDFWEFIKSKYSTAPRGSGRRHFRGVAGLNALRVMQDFSPDPAEFFLKFPTTYSGVKSTCEGLALFGPYYQLKVCDYMDRCLGLTITSYQGLSRNLSSVPAKAAQAFYPYLNVQLAFEKICRDVEDLDLLAPPLFDRPIGPAEIESCLCDWYHIGTGTNWVGSDNVGKRAGFKGHGEKAARMAEFMPPLVPKNLFVYSPRLG